MPFSFLRIYRFLFFSIILLLTLGQLQRFQITPTIAIYLHEVFIGVLIFFVILRDLVIQTSEGSVIGKNVKSFLNIFNITKPRHPREGGDPGLRVTLLLPLTYILFQTLFLTLFNFQPLPLLYLIRWSLYLGFFLSLRNGVAKKFITQSELRWSILIIGGGIALVGLIQYLVWPDTRWLYQYGWDDHYYRLISTLFDPGFTGLIIALSALFYFGMEKNTHSLQYRFLFVPFFLIAILLTYSRASYLAFLIGLVTLTIAKKEVKFLLFALFFLLSVPFLPRPDGEGVKLERTAIIEQRIESNQTALQQLTPITLLLGQGMYRHNISSNNLSQELLDSSREESTRLGRANHAKGPDNSFVFLLTSFGIVGVLSLIPLFMRVMKKIWKQPVLLACFVAWGVHSMFNLSVVYPWVLVMLSVLWIFFTKRVILFETGVICDWNLELVGWNLRAVTV